MTQFFKFLAKSRPNRAFFLFLIIAWLFNSNSLAKTKVHSQFLKSYHETVGDRFYSTREIPGNNTIAMENYKRSLKYADYKADLQWKITRCYWFLAFVSWTSSGRLFLYRCLTVKVGCRCFISKYRRNSIWVR